MATQRIIYGTAWKKERTTALVISAVLNGFRAIDTACQPKHYREDLVGEALQILQEKHGITREDLFLQTKYTPIGGQDRNKPLPYDPSTRLETQINASFQKSLANLRTSYLDSLLLHSPLNTIAQTITAWRTLMALQDSGKVKFIGVSNTYDVAILEALERDGGRKVQVVQNRWFEGNQWDKEVLSYCLKNGVQYQSFWTLSGSPSLLAHPDLQSFAQRKGTTQETHMQQDVAIENVELDNKDEQILDRICSWMGLTEVTQ
ncbi:unnamed protein product [Somion occarium]|uniref:NADP-dependent oxidoreductase domain-containing protein n=1 Tax=Somion occarium TaxID=3059160 RepID=A0ABP1DI42_9APHY